MELDRVTQLLKVIADSKIITELWFNFVISNFIRFTIFIKNSQTRLIYKVINYLNQQAERKNSLTGYNERICKNCILFSYVCAIQLAQFKSILIIFIEKMSVHPKNTCNKSYWQESSYIIGCVRNKHFLDE